MPSLTREQLQAWYPETRSPPPQGTFEIGLVLAGAVSAGAYTAGVLDFLMEALDEWEHAKAEDLKNGRSGEAARVPHHDVRLSVIAGASAGGINGAILAAVSHQRFAPACDPTSASKNPFYRPWVEDMDIGHFLGQRDLETANPPRSILDCTHLEDIAKKAVAYRGKPRQEPRAWIAEPLRIYLTVTNLRGVPYSITFRGKGDRCHEMTAHRDFVHFALRHRDPETALPPDAMPLDLPNAYAGPWEHLAKTALATGAFPLFLAPRALVREGLGYNYRSIFFPEAGNPVFCSPAWGQGQVPDAYRFLCVDGGVMDNEPFEIARTTLAGTDSKSHSPRKGSEANRAVIMVDPFIEPDALGPEDECPLPQVVMSLATALKHQARFRLQDLDLTQREDVYSRFLIAPSRSDIVGRTAIASGQLGGFMGFFSKDYRHHDFLLGRRNCQRFLQAVFTLPRENRLFQGRWSASALNTWIDPTDPTHLPIIPLVGTARRPIDRPKWPARTFQRGPELDTLMKARLQAVYQRLCDSVLDGNGRSSIKRTVHRAIGRAYLWPGWALNVRPGILKWTHTAIDDAVRAIDAGPHANSR